MPNYAGAFHEYRSRLHKARGLPFQLHHSVCVRLGSKHPHFYRSLNPVMARRRVNKVVHHGPGNKPLHLQVQVDHRRRYGAAKEIEGYQTHQHLAQLKLVWFIIFHIYVCLCWCRFWAKLRIGDYNCNWWIGCENCLVCIYNRYICNI